MPSLLVPGSAASLWSLLLACFLVAYGVIEGSRIPADLPECESELVSG